MQECKEAESVPVLGRRLLTNFIVAELFLIAGNLAVRFCQRETLLPTWVIVFMAIATACPMFIFAWTFFRILRSDLDEMLQRVVLEGMGVAMIVFIPLAGIYVNACAAGVIQMKLDPPELLLIPSILVAIGVLISWSRLN